MYFPKLRYEDKVVIFSLLAGVSAWLVDAAVDAYVFGRETFLNSLLLAVSPHELYFRLFVLLCFFLFGVVISSTLTKRRLAENELCKAMNTLADEKAKSEAVIAAIPDGISIQDRNFKVIYQNEVHRSMAGDQIGKTCYEQYARRDSVCPECPVAKSFADGGRHSLEKSNTINGKIRHIEIHSAPLRNATGEIVAGIEAVRDITERKQIEQELEQHRERLADLVEERTTELKEANARLQHEISERERMEGELLRAQKLESIGLLAGGIAHDFNNLLGAIMGNISLAMLDIDPTNPAFQQLSKAEQASLRAQELTQQLLTFSRGGAPVKKPTAIAGLLIEAAGLSLRGSRVLHEINLPKDLWPVDGDEGQLMQVFNNLLINADHAMPNGGIIKIFGNNVILTENELPPLRAGRYVKIVVQDDGIGIPKEHLEKIFDPYFTTKQKGSGLGLSVTYSIIRRHDGHITVESELGKGATFSIFLPASSGGVEAAKHVSKIVYSRGKILIMDDEEDLRRTTADMLTRLGYTVEEAGDGSEALEKYRREREAGKPFDVVIMDLTISGGQGGRETIQKLLDLDPSAKAIVASGYSDDPIMADFRSYGFKGMVRKPYRIREFSEVVAAVIGSDEAERKQ